MEIQVGEYVRTNDGYIAKCIKKDGHFLEFDGYIRTISHEPCQFIVVGKENCITKHSFNVIDLIEEGDYVNGHRVEEIIDGIDEKIITTDAGDLVKGVLGYEIESILTKEQFEANEYKIKEV